MKLRTNYVSNSSSSSFVIPVDLSDSGVLCYPIPATSLDDFCRSLGVKLDPQKKWYLTRFITCADETSGAYDKVTSVEHYVYADGEMDGEPYYADDEQFCMVSPVEGIWMYRSDISEELLSYKDLCKKLNKHIFYLYKDMPDGSIQLIPQHP